MTTELPDATVLILGATSAIAQGAAHAFAKRGYNVFLAGRNNEELKRLASDLSIRYPIETYTCTFDSVDFANHRTQLEQIIKKCGRLAGVLIAFGQLGNQTLGEQDFTEAKNILDQNYTGALSFLTYIAQHFIKQNYGFIIGLSSVAGDRGRRSNYLYGAAKAAFTTLLSGLRARVAPHGVHVLTVKLGFVDTKMTYGQKGLFLIASPDWIGRRIVRAVHKKKNVIYLPWFWRYIMLIIKSIPEAIFKKLNL